MQSLNIVHFQSYHWQPTLHPVNDLHDSKGATHMVITFICMVLVTGVLLNEATN